MTTGQIWVVIGMIGQGVFFMRFVIQWIVSEKKRESVIPVEFWYLSIVGSLIVLAYAVYRKDPVFILGQCVGFIVYTRNLYLIYRKKLPSED